MWLGGQQIKRQIYHKLYHIYAHRLTLMEKKIPNFSFKIDQFPIYLYKAFLQRRFI